jgi:hypothetical protein
MSMIISFSSSFSFIAGAVSVGLSDSFAAVEEGAGVLVEVPDSFGLQAQRSNTMLNIKKSAIYCFIKPPQIVIFINVSIVISTAISSTVIISTVIISTVIPHHWQPL